MRNRLLGAGMALLTLAAAPAARAQVAQVGVAVQLLYTMESVFAADFAPYGGGQQPDFLSITLQNGSTLSQSVVLEVVIRQERPRASELFRGTTNPFVLGPGTRRITNRDLANDSPNNPYLIENYDISSDASDITDQVTQTGRFPAGTYVFQISALRPLTNTLLGRGEVRLELVNPSRVELVSPGTPFGETPELVQSTTPRFQWAADHALSTSGGSFRIVVVPADGAASPEEAMQAFPSWDTRTRETTALYPGAVSAIPLEPGKTYAWQVTRELLTSSGSVFVESPIYWFKVAGAADRGGPGAPAGADLGAALQLETLGSALGLGLQLEGFRPTGQMLVDGQLVSFENLEALLRAILAGTVTVHSITVR
jgi:hypothetical protein